MSDEGLLEGIYRVSAGMWLVVASILAALRCWTGLAGWTVGSAMSVGNVMSLRMVVRHSFVQGASTPKRDLIRASLIKLPVVILILIGLVLLGGRNFALVVGFCAGLIVVQTAIVLKALQCLNRR